MRVGDGVDRPPSTVCAETRVQQHTKIEKVMNSSNPSFIHDAPLSK